MHDQKTLLSSSRTRRRAVFDIVAVGASFGIVVLVAAGAMHHSVRKPEMAKPLLVKVTTHR